MTQQAHTPGHWEVSPIADDRVGVMADDIIVASVYCPHDGHTGEADAALIAAAPDMLAMLQTTAENLRSWMAANTGIKTFDSWLECVDAAIAKATGGQQ